MAVLITGASRGIGLGLLRAYRARGTEVIGTHREPPAPGWLGVDLSDPASIAAMAQGLGGTPIDLLVCNAGVNLDKGHKIESGYPADLWARTFAVNVTGVFLTIQALLPGLRAAQGKIAIISSQMGSDTRPGGASYIYRASKAAALNLGRNLAVDLRGDGIAVGIYHPGWVRTDMGGTGATLGTDEAVAGLVARFEALDLSRTGCFETYDGKTIPF